MRKRITGLQETSLRKKIIIPLLHAVGASNVEDFHGSSEKGKDVYFAYKDLFGHYKHCCFFIKVGNVKLSGKNDARKMKGAIEEAVLRRFVSPRDHKTMIHIEEFYFVCSGKINKEARDFFSELLQKRQMPNFQIFDIDNVVEIISDRIARYNSVLNKHYSFSVRTFSGYCNKIVEYEQKKKGAPILSVPVAVAYIEGGIIQN